MTVTTFFRPESDEDDGDDFEDDVAISSVDTDDKSPTHNPGMISAQVGGCMNDLNVIRMMPYATQMVPPMSLPLSTSDLWLYYAAAVGCRCPRHRHSSSSSSCSIASAEEIHVHGLGCFCVVGGNCTKETKDQKIRARSDFKERRRVLSDHGAPVRCPTAPFRLPPLAARHR
jgi:hypothetical protein